ncbi:MAG: PrsW family intramembrane metalloprotease, partial [Anaerolineales bacterium]|nr:PrsW family intramembrane metalloprotease [Anaerolineales bacterium]
MDSRTLTRYIAPITEEIIKSAFLVYLVRRRSFNYFVDGAIYGFAIGIGFAVVENYRYIVNYQAAAITIAAGRALSTNLIHATGSAIVGVMLGLGRFQRDAPRRVLLFGMGLVIAILIHAGFNNMVLRVGGERWLVYLYAALVGFSGAALILWLIQIGLNEERNWINEMLGVADKVTQGESRVVLRLAEAGVLLAPIVERFGRQKATLIGRLLAVQAQLGILRKTLQTFPGERMQQDAGNQISDLQSEMALLRNRIGVYPMLYLRSIFPNDNYSVWTRLEAAAVRQSEETGGNDFGVADMLQILPANQRRVMQALLRGSKRVLLQDLRTELSRPSRDVPLTEREIVEGVEDLVKTGKIKRVEDSTDLYEVNFGRKARLTLNDNIWERLGALSLDAPASDVKNVWDDLKSLLMEQSKTQTMAQGTNLWITLAQRIHE